MKQNCHPPPADYENRYWFRGAFGHCYTIPINRTDTVATVKSRLEALMGEPIADIGISRNQRGGMAEAVRSWSKSEEEPLPEVFFAEFYNKAFKPKVDTVQNNLTMADIEKNWLGCSLGYCSQFSVTTLFDAQWQSEYETLGREMRAASEAGNYAHARQAGITILQRFSNMVRPIPNTALSTDSFKREQEIARRASLLKEQNDLNKSIEFDCKFKLLKMALKKPDVFPAADIVDYLKTVVSYSLYLAEKEPTSWKYWWREELSDYLQKMHQALKSFIVANPENRSLGPLIASMQPFPTVYELDRLVKFGAIVYELLAKRMPEQNANNTRINHDSKHERTLPTESKLVSATQGNVPRTSIEITESTYSLLKILSDIINAIRRFFTSREPKVAPFKVNVPAAENSSLPQQESKTVITPLDHLANAASELPLLGGMDTKHSTPPPEAKTPATISSAELPIVPEKSFIVVARETISTSGSIVIVREKVPLNTLPNNFFETVAEIKARTAAREAAEQSVLPSKEKPIVESSKPTVEPRLSATPNLPSPAAAVAASNPIFSTPAPAPANIITPTPAPKIAVPPNPLNTTDNVDNNFEQEWVQVDPAQEKEDPTKQVTAEKQGDDWDNWETPDASKEESTDNNSSPTPTVELQKRLAP